MTSHTIGPGHGERLGDLRGEIFALDLHAGQAVRLGHLDEIGEADAALLALADELAEEIRLRGADGKIAAVVEDEDADR